MFRNLVSYCIKSSYIGIYVLCLLYSYALYIFPDSLQVGLLLTILFILGLYSLTRNLLTSLAITFIISSQFFSPAKTYEFEYASATEYVSELRQYGIVEPVALNISDIMGIFIVFLLLKDKLLFIFNKKALGAKRLLISFLQTPPTVWIMFSWFIYFLLSLYGSLYLSFSPTYSLNILMQYAKMVIAFISVLHLFTEVGSKRIFIYIVLLSMLSFQSFMGISQFVGGISNYGMTEKLVTSDIEQNTTFSRIVGIYGSPNSHGFSVAILLLLSLPFIIKRNKWFLSAVGGLGILNIIISQSRSVWLGFLVLLMLYIKQAYNYIRRVLPYIFRKKNLLCSLGIDNIHINSLSENRGKRGFFYRRGRGGI